MDDCIKTVLFSYNFGLLLLIIIEVSLSAKKTIEVFNKSKFSTQFKYASNGNFDLIA